MKMRMVIISVALGLVATACGASATDRGEETTLVTAAVFPLEDVARHISAGRPVEVRNLTPAGAEPHDVELSPDQVELLLDSDALLYVGGGFQPSVEEVAGRRDGVTVDVLEGQRLREDGDPHLWLDPQRMIEIAGRVTAALVEADPGGRETYEENARAYEAELRDLDERFEATLADCRDRTLVVSHAAFGYLTDRYELVQAPIAGLSPEGEPDPARLTDLADLVERENVTTIFAETLAPDDVARTLARETGAGVALLDPIEGLAGEDAETGTTYRTLMERNLEAIAEGLGCAT